MTPAASSGGVGADGAASARIAFGTSGWSYRDWVGPFYPEGAAAGDFLGHYASEFAVVEVDSTYYAVPRASTVRGWVERTPESFRFAPKVPRDVTHGTDGDRPNLDLVLRDPRGVLEAFLETMDILGDRLGPVLFQFPYFRVREMEAADFLDRLAAVLARFPADQRCAVEVRNKGWIGRPLLSLLSAHRAAAVLIDHPYMPGPAGQLRLGLVTTDFAYVRLLGDRHAIEKKTKKWDRVVEDRGEPLKDWAEVIRSLAARDDMKEVFVFSNNHYAGHAPATVRELRAAMESPGI